jgi:hypothetical protein
MYCVTSNHLKAGNSQKHYILIISSSFPLLISARLPDHQSAETKQKLFPRLPITDNLILICSSPVENNSATYCRVCRPVASPSINCSSRPAIYSGREAARAWKDKIRIKVKYSGMGQPIQRVCAAPGCSNSRNLDATAGLDFSAQPLFSKPIGPQATLWACCIAHKREALHAILEELQHRQHKEREDR